MMELQKVIFLYEGCKMVWTRIPNSEFGGPHKWIIELNSYGNLYRVTRDARWDPGIDSASRLFHEFYGQFL